MGQVNILEHMDQFDFSAPISKTIIIEDNNHDYPDSNIPKQQESTYKTCCIFKETIHQQQNKNLNTECNKMLPSEQFSDQTTTEQISNSIEDDSIRADASIQREKSPISTITDRSPCEHKIGNRKENKANFLTNNNIAHVYKFFSSRNDRKGWAMYVFNLLQKVSSDLILIMRAYYNDSCRNHKTFQKVKNNIYSSSYSTIESIILPHEKNEIFIEKFIDMTVADANKVFRWKCEKKHVKPFYDEMITWSKEKKNPMQKTKVNTVIANDQKNIESINKNNNVMSNNTIDEVILTEDLTQEQRGSEDVRCSKIGIKMNSIRKHLVHDDNINEKIVMASRHTNQTHDSRINQENTALLPNTLNYRQIDDNAKSRSINNNERKGNKLNRNTPKNMMLEGTNDNLMNENRMLIENLDAPPRPVNFSHSTVAPIPSLNLNTQNSRCIFSYGAPGQQITINIDQDILVNYTSKQNYNTFGQNARDMNQAQQHCTNISLNTGHSKRDTSINPSRGFIVTGHCNNCGKITAIKCSKCRKISYCSKRCKLDKEARKILTSQSLNKFYIS